MAAVAEIAAGAATTDEAERVAQRIGASELAFVDPGTAAFTGP